MTVRQIPLLLEGTFQTSESSVRQPVRNPDARIVGALVWMQDVSAAHYADRLFSRTTLATALVSKLGWATADIKNYRSAGACSPGRWPARPAAGAAARQASASSAACQRQTKLMPFPSQARWARRRATPATRPRPIKASAAASGSGTAATAVLTYTLSMARPWSLPALL